MSKFLYINYFEKTFRPVMIKRITGEEISIQILKSYNKCLLHFLDIASIKLAREYLESAWKAGAIGRNDVYFVAIEGINQAALLNFSKIFDFQRLWITVSSEVWKLI